MSGNTYPSMNYRVVGADSQSGKSGANSGMKDDSGKLRWDLVEFEELDKMVAVLTEGAQKYEEDNWKIVDNPEKRYFSALMRHVSAWKRGEVVDEDGLSHMAHVMANAMFLMYFEEKERSRNNG